MTQNINDGNTSTATGIREIVDNRADRVEAAGRSGRPVVRTGEEESEQLVIPYNRLAVVFMGLMLTTFLAALDQTIVCIFFREFKLMGLATALPTIVHDLGGAENYSWVGSSYLLASAAFTPMYGRAR